MSLMHQQHEEHADEMFTRSETNALAENDRLIADARTERVKHEAALRIADRKIRSGIATLRSATLRVVSSSR
jgi:hypothetical protein